MKKKPLPVIRNLEPQRSELNTLLELYQNKRYEDAEKLALILTGKFQTHPFGWKVLGAILNQTGRLSEGLIACQKSVELAPENAEAHYNLGVTLKELGRLEESEESCKKAVELAPENSTAHYNLGNTLYMLKKLEKAEESYRKAIEHKPNYTLAHFKLGNLLNESGRLKEGEGAFRQEIILKSAQSEETAMKMASPDALFKTPSPVEYSNLYRKGMGTENVGSFLRAMVLMLRPNRVLEIGAGYTTPFLLEGLVNNERIYDDGNLQASYFENYTYDPKLVVIDDMSLGELLQKPGMKDIISSKYVEFIHGKFEEKADMLVQKYGNFDFVWFDCGGAREYETFINEYWDICSGYIFFHFTYKDGSPNVLHEIILDNVTGNPFIFDIIEPHKKRQGSITMVKKSSYV